MRSSYIDNNLGQLLEQYVKAWRPSSIVELGVLDGYSTIHLARGVKWANKVYGDRIQFDAYDLFEDYAYKHGSREEVESSLKKEGVREFVNLHKGDAYKVQEHYPDMVLDKVRGIEMLHVDISNTGDTIHDIMELWHPKIGQRGLVMLEGGSEERDEHGWMQKYNMRSIKAEIETNPIINKYYIYGTYFQFPSMTVMLRKWWDVK